MTVPGAGPGEVAVLDIGKTNLKLCVADRDGAVIETVSTANAVRTGPPWRHHDLAALAPWVGATLADLSRRHPLRVVVPVGHGSGGVLTGSDPDAGGPGLEGTGAALPMIDYEDDFPKALDAEYRAQAGTFEDRGSPVMMASTHAARQLLRMQAEAPDAVAGAAHYLNVAQYWAWWLSGVPASEHTAMGAQSHLWNVPQRRFAPIVARHGWARLIPPFRPAWQALGPVRPALAGRFGLPAGLTVLTGAHDSSANFYRYRAGGLSDFTLVSTGTWIVALSAEAPVANLGEARGMTINADMAGAPVGGALAMGGREFAAVAGPGWRGARADPRALARIVARGTMALPSFGANEGQFPGSAGRGRIAGPPPQGQDERTALAVLYGALLTVACAEALGGGACLVLDGTFLQEPLYAPLVAALRPGRPTRVSHDPAGVAAGAALLAGHEARTAPVPLALDAPPDLPPLRGLDRYAAAWAAAAAEGQTR
ncbi:MAG: FGGY family carbohydrate kinase [Rhodobacteraceae bacterium]|nr:FGGY family carbohydrate kinase [Paracoccaceae bacterium]